LGGLEREEAGTARQSGFLRAAASKSAYLGDMKVTAKDAMSEIRSDKDLEIARQGLVNAMKLALTSIAYGQLNDSVSRITAILRIRRGEAVPDPE
jgi:hypothetical protein